MSRLTELIAKAKAGDPQLGADLEREFRALSSRLPFGLNFERHRPEAVELPQRPVRRGDKVRVLPPRGSTTKGDQRLWLVRKIVKKGKQKLAELQLLDATEEQITEALDDLVVVAEFRDTIYPGLVSTGKVSRGDDKPWHTVINGENYHVLKALTWTHRGKVDAIYIDPPYNTGAKDWKYNNDYVEKDDLYRHSKWLAFMERRLLVAKKLLNPADSVLIVTIDEKEYLRLGLLLEQVFPEANMSMISSIINPAGAGRNEDFSRTDEYIYFLRFGEARILPEQRQEERRPVTWDTLRRSDLSSVRHTRPGQFYPFYVNLKSHRIEEIGEPLPAGVPREECPPREGCVPVFPIRPDGTEMNWGITSGPAKKRLERGFIRVGKYTKDAPQPYVISYLTAGIINDIKEGRVEVTGTNPDGSVIGSYVTGRLVMPTTAWNNISHDAQRFGTQVLKALIPGRRFPFPKALHAVEDCLRHVLAEKQAATILDFFAGSGTTLHATMRLNKQDGGRRQCISVTNNEVGADEQTALREARKLRPGDPEWEKLGICDYITKPRVQAAIDGQTPDREPIQGEYQFGKTVEREKPRRFKQVGFTESNMFDSATKKKQLVALVNGLPQTLVKEACPFIVSEEHTSSILFDTQHAEDWLEALEGQEHITDFFIVTAVKRTFDNLKQRVADLLGPFFVNEVEEVPMSDGFEENAEFFTLTYETPVAVNYHTAFRRIAPLLWLRAGGEGSRIERQPKSGWEVADRYGLLTELDKATEFLKAVRKAKTLRIAYIVTDDERRFQAIARRLPEGVEAIRLYESYLTNFAFANGDDA